MSYINREEAIRLIMEYQGGAMDKPTAKRVLENMDGVKICEDTISRRAAIKVCEHHKTEGLPCKNAAISMCIDSIKALPSAQPEIIRCKDCKHRPFDSEDTQGFGVEFPDEKCPCQCDDGWYNWRPNNEWFCANAERRTDGVDR